VHCYEQGLEALRQLPESHETLENAIDLRLELRSALHPLGEFDAVLDTLREAQTLAESLADERRRGRVLSYLAQSLRLSGDYPRAIEAGQQALAISATFRDPSILAPANFHLGQTFFHLGDHARAAEFHNSNIRTLDGELARERMGMAGIPVVFSRGHLCWSLAELGCFPEAIANWQAAMRLAEEVRHPFSLAFAQYCGGFLYIRKGELEHAIAQLELGFEMCRSINLRLELPFVATFLGLAYTFKGRPADGIPLVEEAVQQATDLKIKSGQAWLRGMLAYAYVFGGRLSEAAGIARGALDMAQELSEPCWVAWTQFFLGEIGSAGASSGLEQAHAAYESGLKQADALGLRPLVARCELGLGHLLRRTRDQDAAQAHLQRAVASFRDMQMPHWLQKAEAELRDMAVDA
jgi:tetratricopeptide (TPR) repeat protein